MPIFNYDGPIKKYFEEKIRVSNEELKKLKAHCEANEDRIIKELKDNYDLSRNSFENQGSYAMKTLIQEDNNSYDIDDALIIDNDLLKDENGIELSPSEYKDLVLNAINDKRFRKEPQKLKNCVRVYYNEGHHVDIACIRKRFTFSGNEILELPSTDWKQTDPKEINTWFNKKITDLNENNKDSGSQLRRMIRYLKKFSRSRKSWNMPCGLILTMLAVENFEYYKRDDECFYWLLKNILNRLLNNGLVVYNLANKSEILTKTSYDADMKEFRDKLNETFEKISMLEKDNCSAKDAREAWEYVFNTNGFFKADEDDLNEKMNIITKGTAWTSSSGMIGLVGLKNMPHKFYGE